MALKFQGGCFSPTDNAVGYDITVGTFSSATAGHGKKLSSSKTKSLDILCDDGGALLGSGTPVRAARNRMLVTYAQTGEAVAYGNQSQIKITSDCSAATGFFAGIWGYAELVSGGKPSNKTAGVNAMIDVPSGATIPASCYASGVLVSSYDLGGTHTGKAVGMHISTPRTGAFDAAFKFDTSSGITTQAGGTLTITKKIAIVDDAGNTIYIPAGTIA